MALRAGPGKIIIPPTQPPNSKADKKSRRFDPLPDGGDKEAHDRVVAAAIDVLRTRHCGHTLTSNMILQEFRMTDKPNNEQLDHILAVARNQGGYPIFDEQLDYYPLESVLTAGKWTPTRWLANDDGWVEPVRQWSWRMQQLPPTVLEQCSRALAKDGTCDPDDNNPVREQRSERWFAAYDERTTTTPPVANQFPPRPNLRYTALEPMTASRARHLIPAWLTTEPDISNDVLEMICQEFEAAAKAGGSETQAQAAAYRIYDQLPGAVKHHGKFDMKILQNIWEQLRRYLTPTTGTSSSSTAG